MKYFTVNKEPYHCDDIFNYITTNEDGEVRLHVKNPSLHLSKGFWHSCGAFRLQDVRKIIEGHSCWWPCSRKRLF